MKNKEKSQTKLKLTSEWVRRGHRKALSDSLIIAISPITPALRHLKIRNTRINQSVKHVAIKSEHHSLITQAPRRRAINLINFYSIFIPKLLLIRSPVAHTVGSRTYTHTQTHTPTARIILITQCPHLHSASREKEPRKSS